MRKNISAYTKINRRIYADLSAHIRLLGALLSPAVWGGKCWKKERLHLDKSESSTDCHPPRVGQSVDDLSCGGGNACGYFSVPSSRPTLMKAAMALSRWWRSCAAESCTRIRAWPLGTTG